MRVTLQQLRNRFATTFNFRKTLVKRRMRTNMTRQFTLAFALLLLFHEAGSCGDGPWEGTKKGAYTIDNGQVEAALQKTLSLQEQALGTEHASLSPSMPPYRRYSQS